MAKKNKITKKEQEKEYKRCEELASHIMREYDVEIPCLTWASMTYDELLKLEDELKNNLEDELEEEYEYEFDAELEEFLRNDLNKREKIASRIMREYGVIIQVYEVATSTCESLLELETKLKNMDKEYLRKFRNVMNKPGNLVTEILYMEDDELLKLENEINNEK